jgi:hypothetical protein
MFYAVRGHASEELFGDYVKEGVKAINEQYQYCVGDNEEEKCRKLQSYIHISDTRKRKYI